MSVASEAMYTQSEGASQKWRGLMLDTARNLCVACCYVPPYSDGYCYTPSFPVVDIKRVIDAMSWTKVGVNLIADPSPLLRVPSDQRPSLAYCRLSKVSSRLLFEISHSKFIDFSFPLVLKEFPELAEKGAYSSNKKYSTKELDDIVAYANSVSWLYVPELRYTQ